MLLHYSNTPELLSDLRRVMQAVTNQEPETEEDAGVVSCPSASRKLKDTLTPGAVDEMATLYQAGATAKELSKRFGISDRSVRRLMRKAGVRKRG